MGWDNSFHCEWNPFGQKILKHYWPDATSYTDITKTDFSIHRGTIDVLTGGFPCQPYSIAGKRKGKEDERHLWPEMLRAIREIQPSWVVGENVGGLVNWNGGMVFDEVQTQLEVEGYEVQPFILPACAVNAPHRRDRVWFIAYSADNNRRSAQSGWDEKREQFFFEFKRLSEERITPDPCIERCNNGGDNREKRCIQTNEGFTEKNKSEWNGREFGAGATSSISANAGSTGQQKRNPSKITDKQRYSTRGVIEKWTNWPTQSPVCSGNDGISTRLDGITFPKWRNESIKAGGNAIVPQVVHQIFKAIQAYENGNQ